MSSSPRWLNNHPRWRMSLNDQAGVVAQLQIIARGPAKTVPMRKAAQCARLLAPAATLSIDSNQGEGYE
jgi:hypothetical protein